MHAGAARCTCRPHMHAHRFSRKCVCRRALVSVNVASAFRVQGHVPRTDRHIGGAMSAPTRRSCRLRSTRCRLGALTVARNGGRQTTCPPSRTRLCTLHGESLRRIARRAKRTQHTLRHASSCCRARSRSRGSPASAVSAGVGGAWHVFAPRETPRNGSGALHWAVGREKRRHAPSATGKTLADWRVGHKLIASAIDKAPAHFLWRLRPWLDVRVSRQRTRMR